MSNYRNAMRRMRQYTAAVKKNFDTRAAEIEKLSEYKGSPFYDKEVSKVDQKIEAERVRLATAVQKDMIDMVDSMRKNVGKRITQAPTTDMVNSLAILGMLDTINPVDMKQYAMQMADCPLAMKRLQQIAKSHNMQITAPDTEAMMRAVDVIEGNFAMYIQGYTGNDHTMSASVKQLHDLYFQSEESYMHTSIKSCERVDAEFWKTVVGIGSPDMLESNDNMSAVTEVNYFFASLDGLLSFMDEQTAGLSEKECSDKINEILSNCPGQYGAAYRYYKASGEKVPLIETGEESV